jgi:predicted ribosome-associated RNA-binding protein Tma20
MFDGTNATLGPREAIVDSINVYDSGSFGCQKTGADVMVSGCVSADPRLDGSPSFYDLFLTTEQARLLYAALGKVLGA